MRDAAGEAPDGLHLLQLVELGLGLAAAFGLGFLAGERQAALMAIPQPQQEHHDGGAD